MKLEPAIAAIPYRDKDRYLLCSGRVMNMLSPVTRLKNYEAEGLNS